MEVQSISWALRWFTAEWQSHQGSPGRPLPCLRQTVSLPLGRRNRTIPIPHAQPMALQLLLTAAAPFLPWGPGDGECTSEASRKSTLGLMPGRRLYEAAQSPLAVRGLKRCYSLRFKGICKFNSSIKFQSLLFPTHTVKRLQSWKNQSALSFTSHCTK